MSLSLAPSLFSEDMSKPTTSFNRPALFVTTPCEERLQPAFDEMDTTFSSSLPQTPTKRIVTAFGHEGWNRSRPLSSIISSDDEDEDMTRPSSAASMYSMCSYGSMTSFNSFPASHGDRMSPDKEGSLAIPSPVEQSARTKGKRAHLLEARRNRGSRSRQQLAKVESVKDSDWSDESDKHLWTVYMNYSSDATVTPFQVQSGGVPPLGVCCRVAREAKRTWKQGRTFLQNRRVEKSLEHKSPSSKSLPQAWIYSESATRQRLRILCKRKSGDPHHQSRGDSLASPIAFGSPLNFGLGPPPAAFVDDFSTRNLNFSLISSTAPSMQPEGPLASMSSGFNPDAFTQPACPAEDALPVPANYDDIPLIRQQLETVMESPSPLPSTPSHKRSQSHNGTNRRNSSRGNVLHRKTESAGIIGHRRNASSITSVSKLAAADDVFASANKQSRSRSSSDATIKPISRILCLGSPFGSAEENDSDATRKSKSTVHKRGQSLQSPLARRIKPEALMPAIDFTKMEAYQNAIRQQEEEKELSRQQELQRQQALQEQQQQEAAMRSHTPSNSMRMHGDRKRDHFFEDLFGSRNSGDRENTGGSTRGLHKKTRSRGLSITRGQTPVEPAGHSTPPHISRRDSMQTVSGSISGRESVATLNRRDSLQPDDASTHHNKHSMLRRLGSPFKDPEFAPLSTPADTLQATAIPQHKGARVPTPLSAAFSSPPRHRRRAETPSTPGRESGLLSKGLGFLLGRRGRKDHQ